MFQGAMYPLFKEKLLEINFWMVFDFKKPVDPKELFRALQVIKISFLENWFSSREYLNLAKLDFLDGSISPLVLRLYAWSLEVERNLESKQYLPKQKYQSRRDRK